VRRFIMADIRKMAAACFANVDDAACRPNGASKFRGGALRVSGRAEARHDYNNEVFAREGKPIYRRRRAK
jgi:hypothetical protein